MGSIQKAYDVVSQEHVAIKRMLLQGDAERQKTSFQREADALGKLEHPNIVSLVKVDQDTEGRWYLALEWLEETIEAYILRKGAIPWNKFYTLIGKPVLDALVFAQTRHQIAHRDLNPRNIMMTVKEVPKITDYGISKVFGRDPWMPVIPTDVIVSASRRWLSIVLSDAELKVMSIWVSRCMRPRFQKELGTSLKSACPRIGASGHWMQSS